MAEISTNSGKINVSAGKNIVNVGITKDYSQYFSQLSKDWATKINGLVNNEDYSSKYYAEKSKDWATDSENNLNSVISQHEQITSEIMQAREDISTDLSGALLDIETSKNAGLTSIDNAKTNGITAVNTVKADSVSAVQKAQTTAETSIKSLQTSAEKSVTTGIANIETSKQNAISDIITAGAEQVTNIQQTGFYMQDDKLYYINSDGETKEFKSGSMPIGMIFPMLCSSSYVPNGALPLDGTEYTKALFPNFYTNFLVAGLLNTCTYDEYASDITTYGQCGKFALDTVNEKFKVPTIKDGSYLTQALSNTELGKAYNESLPNIQGGINGYIIGNYVISSGTAVTFTGALKGVSTYSGTISGGNNHFQAISNLSLDASKASSTYQNNAKVQGDNVRVRYFVQVANGQINQSDMDWSAFTSALQGKLNKDHSNDEKPYIEKTYVNGTSGFNLYSNGYCEQWGRVPAGEDGDYTITLLQPYKNTDYQVGYTLQNITASKVATLWEHLSIAPIDGSTVGGKRVNFERGWFASGYTA